MARYFLEICFDKYVYKELGNNILLKKSIATPIASTH